MNIEIKQRIRLDAISDDGTCSVLTQEYFELNGQKTVISNHREALVPGQIDRAKEILPDHLYKAVKAMWTKEIVAAWEEKQKAANEELPAIG